MEFLAHISDDGRKQTVQEHLEGTARLCSEFAAAFDAAEQGYLAGISHDIGKYTEAFQRRLRGGPKVDHATAGAMECAKAGFGQAAVCVIGHHSGLPDMGNERTDQPGDATFYGRIKKGLMGGIEPYKDNWPGKLPKTAPAPASARSGFSGAAWTRMLYSCLVDADYLDTERFMQPYKLSRGGYDGMERLLGKLEKHIEKWANPENEMNKYRWEILSECLRCGEKPKGIYTLTVPTGGGKTVSSMAFALRHAVAHGMKHIIYVIPYTSIIEQNAAVFKEILGEDNVLEHHSGKLYELEDASSPAQYRLAMATENWDMPVIVTTAVQFFESFYSNRSSKCRKLHSLANSVIIFDEAQMLPTCHLQPCVGAIAELVRHFGATAVLCTATQPVLGDIFKRFGWSENIPELCPGTQALYEKFRRVSFRNAGGLSNEMLAGELKNSRQVLCIVNSRRAAQEIYDMLPKEGAYHLSTLMYPAHRQRVLNEIRQRLKEGAVCRVLSTSLIEAGVDVDFPTVYREMAGLDSILQAAGRCNREGRRSSAESIVAIFESEYTSPLLIKNNIGAANEALAGGADPALPETITKYFSSLRDIIGDGTDKAEVVKKFERGISGCMMPFDSVAQGFHMIDNNTKTVYIPLEEGAAIAEKLKSGFATREVYRKAGRYGVNAYDIQYRRLLDAGNIEPLDENSAVLVNMELYDKNTGLSLDCEQETGFFI